MIKSENQSLQSSMDEVNQATRHVSDAQLNAAVQQGMRRARQAKSKGKLRSWKAMIAASAALLLLLGSGTLLTFQAHERDEHSSAVEANAELPDYMNQLYRMDYFRSSLPSAVEHGLYQPINQSAETDHYKLTIDGVVADSQRVIVFYTADNKFGTSEAKLSGQYYPKLINKQEGMGNGSFVNSTVPGSKPGSSHGALVFDYHKWQQIPSALTLTSELYSKAKEGQREHVEIPFQIDTQRFQDMKQEHILNKAYTLDDYTIHLISITQTPLRTDVEFDLPPQQGHSIENVDASLFYNDPANSLRVPLDLQRYVDYKKNDSTHFILYYDSTYFAKDQSLWLGIERIKLKVEQPVPLTINTKTNQIITAPDNNFRLKSVTNDANTGQTTVALSYVSKKPQDFFYLLIKSSFTDDAGKTAWLKENYITGESDAARQYELVFDNKKKSLKQPFTFQVENYPGPMIYPKQPIYEQIN